MYCVGSIAVQVLQLRERISELEDAVEKEGNQVKAVFMLREVLLVAHGQVRHVCVACGAPLSLLLLLSYLLLPSTVVTLSVVRCCMHAGCWCFLSVSHRCADYAVGSGYVEAQLGRDSQRRQWGIPVSSCGMMGWGGGSRWCSHPSPF